MKDFPSFCALLQVAHQEGGHRINFTLSPIHLQYIAERSGRDIVLKPRQIFFTSLEIARDVWWFLTKRGARVVVMVQSAEGNKAIEEIAMKIRIAFESIERLGVEIPFSRKTNDEWEIASRDSTLAIIGAGASAAAAKKKGRSGHINRLHLSETAFWEYGEETFNSIESSVSAENNTEICIESTANGASGFYYKMWRNAVDGTSAYKPHFFPWYEHPTYIEELDEGEVIVPQSKVEKALMAKGVAPERIKWRRNKIKKKGGNEDLVDQEYPSDPETCFLISGRCFFDKLKLSAQIVECSPPIDKDARDHLWIWKKPVKGRQYVIGADVAEGGSHGDFSAATILDRETGEHVATLYGQVIPEEWAKLVAYTGKLYNWATIAVERNNHGHAVIMALRAMFKYPPSQMYTHDDGKIGWNTGERERTPMLDQLNGSHRRGTFVSPDARVNGEMRTFIVNDSGRPEGAKGAHDDLVMCTAIAWAVRNRPQKQVGLSLLDDG